MLAAQFGIEYFTRSTNHLPQARQQAITSARTQWLGFIDADCRIDESWVRSIQRRLQETTVKIAAIGGPWKITGVDAPIYQGLFASFLGHFGNSYLSQGVKKKSVEHLPTANIIYCRNSVLDVGGFSSTHPFVGEDLDLSYRLIKKGLQIEYDPELRIEHQLPSGLSLWSQKMFLYGTANGEMLLRYKSMDFYKLILPVLFFPVFLGLWFFSNVFFLMAICSYLAVCLLCSLNLRRLRLCFPVALRMMATHVFYSLGIYYGCSKLSQVCLKKKLAQ
jgi:cellulose synthase/poly-beta-1,6-N-acetylglucosamine synthase-like glycosyltransferase